MQQTNVVNDYVVNPYTLTIFGIRLSSEHGKRQSFGHMACFVEGELLIKRWRDWADKIKWQETEQMVSSL